MSGAREHTLVLLDMIAAVKRLLELARDVPASGETDQQTAEMVLWNLTLLGEAAKRMPDQIRSRYTDVQWAAMARTRDVVVHHYEVVDWQVIRGVLWDYLPKALPRLIEIRDEVRNEAG